MRLLQRLASPVRRALAELEATDILSKLVRPAWTGFCRQALPYKSFGPTRSPLSVWWLQRLVRIGGSPRAALSKRSSVRAAWVVARGPIDNVHWLALHAEEYLQAQSVTRHEEGYLQIRHSTGEGGLPAIERDERQTMRRARQGNEQVVNATPKVHSPSIAEHILVRVGRGNGDPIG